MIYLPKPGIVRLLSLIFEDGNDTMTVIIDFLRAWAIITCNDEYDATLAMQTYQI